MDTFQSKIRTVLFDNRRSFLGKLTHAIIRHHKIPYVKQRLYIYTYIIIHKLLVYRYNKELKELLKYQYNLSFSFFIRNYV